MNIKRGIDGRFYAVFRDERAAERWRWFWQVLLSRRTACFGGYDNAYRI